MKTSGNTILMTGGGSGIGEAFAHRWHDMGNTVIVTGRRSEALDRSIEGRENMHAVSLDVTDPESIAGVADAITERFPKLNMLVNNAGIMRFEDLTSKRDLGDAEQTIETNLLGPIRMIDAFVDHLAAQDDAAIVNVTSGLAYVPLPKTATYNATKAALHSYSDALRYLLKDKVRVIELAPPAVRTDLTPGQKTREGYQPLDEFADEVMALWTADPDASSIDVENVKPLKHAREQGRYDEMLEMLGQR